MLLKKAITVISIALVAGLMAMMPVSEKEARVIKMAMQPSCTSLATADIDERPAAGMMLSYKEKGEMNKVIWLNDGKTELGSHDELIEKCSEYALLYNGQNGGGTGEK